MNGVSDSPNEESPKTDGGTSQTPSGGSGQKSGRKDNTSKVADSEDAKLLTHSTRGRNVIGLLSALVLAVIGSLIAKFIADVILTNAWASPFIALCIGVFVLVLLVCFIAALLWRRDPKRKWEIIIVATVATVVAILVLGIIYWSAPLSQWRFEDGTVQGWGEYDGPPDKNTPPAIGVSSGIALPSKDVVVSQSGEPSRGKHALKVENIILLGKDEVEKWPAVNVSGETLRGTRLRARVFAPPDMRVGFADVKFFLLDGNWDWQESGTLIPEKEGDKLGTVLIPGTWVDLYWDLGSDEAKKWPTPWKDVLGIKILLQGQGQFDGPIYIDDITVSRRLPWLSTD